MQVKPVFTQVDTGFLCGNSVVCRQTRRSSARSAGGECTGFSPGAAADSLRSSSLKTASSLSKFTQTWREKPANSSDMVHFSGKSLRLAEKIGLLAVAVIAQSV